MFNRKIEVENLTISQYLNLKKDLAELDKKLKGEALRVMPTVRGHYKKHKKVGKYVDVMMMNDQGEVVQEFKDVREAAKFLKVPATNISHAIKHNSFAKGYYWSGRAKNVRSY